jgi:hypothetical protein
MQRNRLFLNQFLCSKISFGFACSNSLDFRKQIIILFPFLKKTKMKNFFSKEKKKLLKALFLNYQVNSCLDFFYPKQSNNEKIFSLMKFEKFSNFMREEKNIKNFRCFQQVNCLL